MVSSFPRKVGDGRGTEGERILVEFFSLGSPFLRYLLLMLLVYFFVTRAYLGTTTLPKLNNWTHRMLINATWQACESSAFIDADS